MEEDHIKELTNLKPKELKKALEGLKKIYEERNSALFILKEGTKWKITVKEEFIPLVKSLVAETELERPVLQTLAVIAYRSPMLQSDVIKARGAGAYEYISELVDRGFITKEKFGRSYKLKTTEKFYHYFDVEGDADIRELFKDIKPPELDEKEVQKKLGELQVVEAESDEDHEKHREEMKLKIVEIEKKREEDKSYLDTFDDRLGEVQSRVDVTEKELEEQKSALPEENVDEHSENKDPQELVKEIEEDIEELTKKE